MAPKRQPSPFRAMTSVMLCLKSMRSLQRPALWLLQPPKIKCYSPTLTVTTFIITNGSSGTSLRVQAVENDGVTAQTATAISLAANGGNDTTQVVGTLRLSSSSGFTVTQTNGSSDTFFADGTATAALESVGVIDISTQIGASYSIATIDGALERVSGMRGSLGTLQNRLDYSVSNLMKVTEYTIGARSRIEDADFAAETSRLAKAQVLQQAGASMLSQANASTEIVLQVLRDKPHPKQRLTWQINA